MQFQKISKTIILEYKIYANIMKGDQVSHALFEGSFFLESIYYVQLAIISMDSVNSFILKQKTC